MRKKAASLGWGKSARANVSKNVMHRRHKESAAKKSKTALKQHYHSGGIAIGSFSGVDVRNY